MSIEKHIQQERKREREREREREIQGYRIKRGGERGGEFKRVTRGCLCLEVMQIEREREREERSGQNSEAIFYN